MTPSPFSVRDPGVWAISPCPLNTQSLALAPQLSCPHCRRPPPLTHLSVLCPGSSPADRGPHIGRAGVGVGVGAGDGRRGSPRPPPWPRTTWCPWSRSDRPPGRPPCGRSPRPSGGGRRQLRPGPPGCPPTSPGVPRGLGWAPLVGGPRSWGRGGWPGGVRPRESAWPGGAARPPLPSPSLAGPPPSCASPRRGGLRCGPADAAGRGPPRPPTRPLSSASSSSPPPPATSSFLSGTLTSPSGDSGPFPKVNPFGGGRGSGGRGRAWAPEGWRGGGRVQGGMGGCRRGWKKGEGERCGSKRPGKRELHKGRGSVT